nr:MAG TPA: hypothetical protein [Caudoviricetes sp.]
MGGLSCPNINLNMEKVFKKGQYYYVTNYKK